jgi:hypothetical protein
MPGPSAPGASLSSTAALGVAAESTPAFYVHPGNAENLLINHVTLGPSSALTAVAPGTGNYATLTLRARDSSGSVTATVNIDFTTSAVGAGRYFTGSIAAYGSVQIDLASTITLPSGGSLTAQISKTGGSGQATPAFRAAAHS